MKYYFIFCFSMGLVSFYFVTKAGSSSAPQAMHFSSQSELYSGEMNSFEASLADQEILENFTVETGSLRERGNEAEQVLSVDAQESFDRQLEQLKNEFSRPESISWDDPYQKADECTGEALEIEKTISQSAAVADLIQERPARSQALGRQCVNYVMKGMVEVLPSSRLATCPKGARSEPLRDGPRICLTRSMVNLTYNSYMDVADCLGLNPKDILPKLANESGFLVNTYGAGSDAGVGQLTRPAIEEVNTYYASYLADIESQAKTNPACARIIKHKALLNPVAKEIAERCSLITVPENPLKNFLYMGIFNKININVAKRLYATNNIAAKFEKLGLRHVNEEQLIGAIASAGYNSGVVTAFRILNKYLDKRIEANLKLKASDFDFHSFPKVYDEIGKKETDVLALARSYVMAIYIRETDTEDIKKIKTQKIKLLPRKIKQSYKLTFPEFMTYNQNNFDGVSEVIDSATFKNVGAPGYLTFLALNDIKFKQEFAGKPYNCSNPQFFKIK